MMASGSCLLAVVVGVPLLGLCSVGLARMSEGWTTRALFQQLFVGCLLVVAAMTVLTFAAGAGCWITSAATLPLMALPATRRIRSPASTSRIGNFFRVPFAIHDILKRPETLLAKAFPVFSHSRKSDETACDLKTKIL